MKAMIWRVGLLTWFWVGLTYGDSATAQVTVAVRAGYARPALMNEAKLVALGKLSPELRVAMGVKATFVGQTRDGRAILQFPQDVRTREARRRLAAVPGVSDVDDVIQNVIEINQLIVNYHGEEVPAEKALAGLAIVDRYEKGRFVVVQSDDGFTPTELQGLVDSEKVQFVEPNHQYHLAQETIPDDPDFENLWGMRNIRAPVAWSQVNQSPNVIVAVIDTGIAHNHEDIHQNMWVNDAEKEGRVGVDDDSNGYIDDVYGYDFYNRDGDPVDGHGHGTHCAGTIGAVGNNGIGVVGVTWRVRFMALQIFNKAGAFAGAAQAAKAIDYAVDNGADILSNSWGGGAANENIRNAITRAEEQGALFVAAAGNDFGNDTDRVPHFPSSYPNDNIIAVLSIDEDNSLSDFSNFGKLSVDLGAPGRQIFSTVPGGYSYMSGTSMATPHVSGAAALTWEVAGVANQRISIVKERLLGNARPLASLAGKCLTGGTLDVRFLANGGPQLAAAVPVRTAVAEERGPKDEKVAQAAVENARPAIDNEGNRPTTITGNVMDVKYIRFNFREYGKTWVTKTETVTPPAGWKLATVSVTGKDLHFGHDYYEAYSLGHIGAYASVDLLGNGDIRIHAHALVRERASDRPWAGNVQVRLDILGP